MIIKGIVDPEKNFRKVYPINSENIKVKHFAVRTITPDNPFVPHKHEQEELQYIIEGDAIFFKDGKEYEVEAGDLIHIEPWVDHGLSTKNKAIWICLG